MEILFTGIVIFILAAIFYSITRKSGALKNKQQLGLSYIGTIKNIIVLVQQHRGLNAAWLNGDKKIETKLMMLKQHISILGKELKTTELAKDERWIGFNDHWQRLLQLNNQITPANSFEQHTKMVRNLAYFLEDTAEKYCLTSDFLMELPNIGFVWRELVQATENIGQSRALGSGITAKKVCSSVEKIRLNFLTQNMTSVTTNILKQLSCLENSLHSHNELVKKATQKMQQLIDTINHELVNAEKITLDNAEYFELASDTMNALNNIFDDQLKQIAKIIE